MSIKLAVLALTLLVPRLAVGQATPSEITNADVISMAKAGIGDQTIMLAIQRGPVKFDMSPQALIALKGAGVSDLVLNAILAAANSKGQISPEAKNSSAIAIRDPVEFSSYQQATAQTDPTAKGAALEGFLQTYPQSVVKSAVLDMLIDAYQRQRDQDKALGAATGCSRWIPIT